MNNTSTQNFPWIPRAKKISEEPKPQQQMLHKERKEIGYESRSQAASRTGGGGTAADKSKKEGNPTTGNVELPPPHFR